MALTCLVPARLALDTDIIASNHISQRVAQYIPSRVIRMTDLRPDGVARVVQSTNPFISHFTYFYVLFFILFFVCLFNLLFVCPGARLPPCRLAPPPPGRATARTAPSRHTSQDLMRWTRSRPLYLNTRSLEQARGRLTRWRARLQTREWQRRWRRGRQHRPIQRPTPARSAAGSSDAGKAQQMLARSIRC